MTTAWKRLAILAVAGLGVTVSWSEERRSLERANRLLRAGQVAEAEALYAARALAAPSAPEVRYNLGTALVTLGSATGEIELSRAIPRGDADLRGRAQYNTGLSRLDRALDAQDPDSVRTHASAAVGANRMAIRLRPEDQNAKWNLAMALRLLDSIDAIERRSGREITDGAVEADVVTRSVNVPDAAEDERAEDPPAEGESETVAVVGEESPLTLEEAIQILSDSHLDATTILGKLIALQSRGRWGRPGGRGLRRW